MAANLGLGEDLVKEAQLKFRDDWLTVYPDTGVPDTSFLASKQGFLDKISECERRVQEFRSILQREEFVLSWLRKTKADSRFTRMYIEDKGSLDRVDLVSLAQASPTRTNSLPSLPRFSSFGEQLYTGRRDSLDTVESLRREDVSSFSSFKPRASSHNHDQLLDDDSMRGSLSSKKSASLQSKPIHDNEKLKLNHSSSSDSDDPIYENVEVFSKDSVNFTPLENSVAIRQAGAIGSWHASSAGEKVVSNVDAPSKGISSTKIQRKISEGVVKERISRSTHRDENKSRRKRLGSQDRQGFVFEEFDVTSPGLTGDEGHITVDIEDVMNGLESCVDDDTENFVHVELKAQPKITVNDDRLKDSDNDDPLYESVGEFLGRPLALETDSGGSDIDDSSDAVSQSDHANNYREMTSDEIATLKRWQSDEDLHFEMGKVNGEKWGPRFKLGTLDEDSDEGPSPSVVQSKINRNSKFQRVRPKSTTEKTFSSGSNEDLQESRGRIATSPTSPHKRYEADEEDQITEEVKASRMRKYLVFDLLDSEKNYLDCLIMLAKFMKPLQMSTETSQPILTVADFKAIFQGIDELLVLHRDFMEKLEPRVEHWTDKQVIGDLFSLIMHGFSLYKHYIGNYKTAMDTILKCRNANQQFDKILDQDIRIPSLKDPVKLDGLLYKPVDRMTKYSLILNDLLKYTPEDHPDHPLVVEVTGALFDLFEQVNVDSGKKSKRKQRQLLKEGFMVELDAGERRARCLILFNDVLICAKLKPSRDAYVCKWYVSLAEISLKPLKTSEEPPTVPISSKEECDKLRASIANLKDEIRKEHMPLQQSVSTDEKSPPLLKRRIAPGPQRASTRAIEKLRKKISENERLLSLIAPSTPLNIYHDSGKVYTLILALESEKLAWKEALAPRIRKLKLQDPGPIHLSTLELQQAFETVLKVQHLGSRFGAFMPAPGDIGPSPAGRPMSMDISSFFDDKKDSLSGFLYVNILSGKGFARNADIYCALEIDSYGHFFRKAKTKAARGPDPQWEEDFDFEVEACSCLRLVCFTKLRLMGDDVCGKTTINLARENLRDNRNHSLTVGLDRGAASISLSVSFSTTMDGIKKSKSFSDHGVFGVPIAVVCKREKSDIPVIVISCIKEIEKRGMDEVGIYRLSGIASEIQGLKKLFNESTQSALLAIGDADIHAVAGLLKLYFRELPNSLLSRKLYQKFVDGLSITEQDEKELYMMDVLNELSRPNKLTALYLFEHLKRVSEHEKVNKMGVNNLATVFGPTVLRPLSPQDQDNERSACSVGSFDIGALDVMSQVATFKFFLSCKSNRLRLPEDDLELWRRLDPEKAIKLEERLMETAEEYLI